jgi:SAM-dependent methyltransferase
VSRMDVALARLLHVPTNSIVSVSASSGSSLSVAAGLSRSPEEAMRLEALLRDVEDLSSLSPELLARAIAENCWYHVTPFRSALLRVLELPKGARILEVGCGGGALTRYLGEQGYDVVALETSELLAGCAKLRCQDLSNVEVVHGFFEDIVDDKKFDFVISVDPQFAESESFDPGVQLFALCKKVLKATGSLIVAVGNSLYAPGGVHIEPSRNGTRGSSAPLEALKRSLAGAGFSHSEHYVTFPHHAAPQLLLDVEQARRDRAAWIPLIKDLYRSSEHAERDMEKWWKGLALEGLEDVLAPGWLILAHAHSVHSVLWNSKSGKYFVPQSSQEGSVVTEASEHSIAVSPLHVAQADIISGILEVSKPDAHAVQDFKESLVAADKKIEQLGHKETIVLGQLQEAKDALVVAEDQHASEVFKEQEARRIREAELGLVLKQYHAVGAMCHDMREEGRKLKDMLDELRKRYVASEEWGTALSKRIAEAEAELQQAKSSRVYRLVEKVKGLFIRPRSVPVAKMRCS